jgi:phosphoglycolate phosphatase-like HAD superfamily hydrolase
MNAGPYRTWLFDCDGVLLDSNRIKTEAFGELVMPFGADIASAFVAYHVANGGVSRMTKLRYLFEHLLRRPVEADTIEQLAGRYGAIVREQLLQCPETQGLRELLGRRPPGSRSFVVSGADEVELREILSIRGLAREFDGIFGSPRTKVEILAALAETEPLGRSAVFLGDSRYDHETAVQFGIDFIFVSSCSELADWPRYIAEHGVASISQLGELHPR